MPIALSSAIGQTFNDLYAQRPVWAIISNNSPSGNSPMVAPYAADNAYIPLNVEFPGNAKTRARAFQDEVANSGIAFSGSTTQPAGTTAWTPQSGVCGITGCSQTGFLHNFEIYDNGNYGWYNATVSDALQLASMSGVVVGEPTWRQTFDLLITNGGVIYKDEIGGGYNSAVGGNKPFINLNSIGGQFASTALWGWGQIAHNRNTGKLLVAQPVTGVNGASLTFRFHLFDLQNKIGKSTTISQLRAWIIACVAAGSNRYRYFDVVCSSANVYWANNTQHDIVDTQFVLCDDDNIWAFKSSETATGGAGNCLWTIRRASGTWLTGVYSAITVINFNNATNYGLTSGHIYGARHMNSDDNSVVALFQHAQGYNNGYNAVFVSSASSGLYNYAALNTTAAGQQHSIAPSGGPNFVMCNNGFNNDGGQGPRIAFLNNETLSATAINLSYVTGLYPSVASSTLYGANAVVKVQPTTEFK